MYRKNPNVFQLLAEGESQESGQHNDKIREGFTSNASSSRGSWLRDPIILMTIRLRAHRASVYGTTSATKTAALIDAAKDQGREFYIREIMVRPIRPIILDE